MERDGGQGQGLMEKRAQRRLKFGQEEHLCHPKPPSHRDGNTFSLSVGRPLSPGIFLLLSSLPEDAPFPGLPSTLWEEEVGLLLGRIFLKDWPPFPTPTTLELRSANLPPLCNHR